MWRLIKVVALKHTRNYPCISTYIVDGVVHYCVANMPGAVARTSTFALNNATIGHAIALAEKGWKNCHD